MPPEAEVIEIERISSFAYMVQTGGIPFCAIGLVLLVWGVILTYQRASQSAILTYAFFGLLSGLFAMVQVYIACNEFSKMAVSPIPPKPHVFAELTGRCLSAGFFGLMTMVITLLFVSLCLGRLSRSGNSLNKDEATS